MQTKRSLAVMLGAFAAGATLALSPAMAPSAAAAPTPVTAVAASQAASIPLVTHWEYATVPLPVNDSKATLDRWGADGWELIQVAPSPKDPNVLVAFLKREVTPA